VIDRQKSGVHREVKYSVPNPSIKTLENRSQESPFNHSKILTKTLSSYPIKLRFTFYIRPMGHAIRTYSDHYTVTDWEKWNDQWELIDGMPYCMSPAPSIRHQQLNLG
jgi:hypothetical protein